MNTYNIDNVLRDFNTLLDLYLNSSSEEKKINIYSQMLFIYNIEPKLVKGSKLFSYKPSNYSIYTRKRETARKKRYLELDNLTRKICFNLWEEINKYYPLDTSRVPNDIYSYEEYVSMLRTFFKENFPSDLELFNKDIEENNLTIRKSFPFSNANIYYLESLKKYYINIEYYKRLNAFNIASTVHEYGHASTFMQSNIYTSRDYILNEAIASLYEIIFLDYYLSKYGNEYSYIEMIRIFNTACINSINRTIRKGYNYKEHHINMIEALYGQLIAATIYIKYRDKDLNSIIEILKNNYSKADGFELLRSIDISIDDLIDTSEDISKLVLRR